MWSLINYVLEINEFSKSIRHRLLVSSLAYYLVLSLVPIVTTILYVSSIVISDTTPIIDALSTLIDPGLAHDIVKAVANKSIDNYYTLFATTVVSIWIISNGFHMTIRVMNDMYNAKEESYFIVRLRAIFLTIIVILVISLTMIVSTVIPVLLSYFHLGRIWIYVQYPAYVTFIFAATAIFYHYGPDVKLPYKAVYPGAVFCGIGTLIVIYGFNLYSTYFANYENIYGPIASTVIILVVFNLIANIIYIGLCMNVVYYMKNY